MDKNISIVVVGCFIIILTYVRMEQVNDDDDDDDDNCMIRMLDTMMIMEN